MAAPTVITVQQMKGPFETYGALSAHYTYAAGTITDGDVIPCTGREIILVKNGTGTNTITFTSVADEKGRTGDITTYSIAAGLFAAFGVGLTNSPGWLSTARQIRVTVSSAEVTIAVLRLPAGFPK